MARMQILELPEGSSDDRPPFVLVVDQYEPPPYPDVPDTSPFDGIAEKIGARAVLVFEETIDIPANDVPLDPDGYPVKLRIEPDFETFRKQVQDEIRRAQADVTRALCDADEPETDGPQCRYCGADCSNGRSWDGGDLYAGPSCADWRAKLNQHKAALLDALGMDRTRDWDDIRNAAAGLRKSNEARGEAIDRVLDLPYQPDFMNAQHDEPAGYQHGYRIAIQDAKRAVGHQSEHPTEKQARA
jgi:hypothetical protein